MDTALAFLGAVVLILAFASLFISRRFGDRFQNRLLLALGVLGIGLYAASLAAYGSSSDDWVGLAISAGAAGMAIALLREPGWYERVYVPWSRRHLPSSHAVNVGAIPLSLGVVYALVWWLFGTRSAVIAALAGALYFAAVFAYVLYRRWRRTSRARSHLG